VGEERISLFYCSTARKKKGKRKENLARYSDERKIGKFSSV